MKNEYVGNFYPTYVDFCNKAGLSPSAVAEKVGLSRTAVTGWKKGTTPSYATCAKIADFFGVSVDYLLGAEQEKPAISEDDELNTYLDALKNREEMRILFSLTASATKEDVEKAVKIIEALFDK